MTTDNKQNKLTDSTDAAYAPSRSRAWAEIDLASLAHNVRYLQSLLPDHCSLMPVVKANAYGHGAALIAGALNTLGIYSFCVACVSEGVELRKQNITGEILVLGYTHPDQFPLLDQYALTQTVVDHAHALALSTYACSASRQDLCARTLSPLPVHIAVDTGMHRLGEPAEHAAQIREMLILPGLQITGIYTHLAAASGTDATSRDFTREQIDTFFRLTANTSLSHMRLHLQASYGILRYPLPNVDCARPGIALYGLLSNAADTRAFAGKLHPVLSLRARVASVHYLSPGESAGYDMAYTATRPAHIATVTIGYADGLPRSLSEGRGKVLLHGQPAPIVGRICMDQLLVDVTAIPKVIPGDIATLIGCDGQLSISAADLADACGTITNELLCCLGPRLERMAL
ncbi:MAG: serine racemase VanT catalytic subunit [Acetatifactor sp.]|nr:serine racemase VanT catalytic subunit [Acetatifactor sp.]